MKRILSIIMALALTLAALTGCSQAARNAESSATEAGDRLSIVSTIFPGYDFARQIAGDNVSLSMLLPPGAESHSFEPTPQDIIEIQNCDLFICVGGESESWIEGILGSMDTSDITVLSMMELVEVVEEEIKEGMEEVEHDHENDGDGQDKAEYDEHVWTSPVNAMGITEAIADALCALDEENADAYHANAAAYIAQLEGLDAAFREVAQSAARDTLIFADRFPFRYFAEEYGLDYYAAFPGCSAETEASAKTVAFLIDKISAEDIPVVFYIEFSNERMADAICESTGAEKLLFHSCHNVTKSDFEAGIGYLELMTRNLENLRACLVDLSGNLITASFRLISSSAFSVPPSSSAAGGTGSYGAAGFSPEQG